MKRFIALLLIISLISITYAEDQPKKEQQYILVKEYKNLGLIIPAIGMAVWAGINFNKSNDYGKTAELFKYNKELNQKYINKESDFMIRGVFITAGSICLFTIAISPTEKKIPINLSMTSNSIKLTYDF